MTMGGGSIDAGMRKNIVAFVQGNLRKLGAVAEMSKKSNTILANNILHAIFQPKTYNEDIKKITEKLLNTEYSISEHNVLINETDRTTIGLLWHENVIDVLEKMPIEVSAPFYKLILDNICQADYFDRITFQNQIWLFNELSSLIKTFYNHYLYHKSFPKKPRFHPTEVRFTKVLTKYSTEYNNQLFIQSLCMQLSMDQKDLFAFFLTLKKQYTEDEIPRILEMYEITKLDVNRIYRYLDKYMEKMDPGGGGGGAGVVVEYDTETNDNNGG